MRTFDNTTAATNLVRDIKVARWDQYSLGELVPFQSMWYTLPPGSGGVADCHPERELSVVLSGSALVAAGGRCHQVRAGNAFLLDSMEEHNVQNPVPDRPLLVFSSYWMPDNDIPAMPSTERAFRV